MTVAVYLLLNADSVEAKKQLVESRGKYTATASRNVLPFKANLTDSQVSR